MYINALHIQVHESDEIDDEPTDLTLQEPPLTESLRAVQTLYNLALFRSHEPEFSGFFNTLSNVRSHLKAEQRDTLKSSKIMAYFPLAETKKMGAVGSGTNSSEAIWVD